MPENTETEELKTEQTEKSIEKANVEDFDAVEDTEEEQQLKTEARILADKIREEQPGDVMGAMNELRALSKRKIEEIGYIDAHDIMDAFKDHLTNGQNTTVIEIREDYLTPDGEKTLRSYQRLLTIDPVVSVEASGEYTSVILDFKKETSDIHILWDALEKFGKEYNDIDSMSEEIPQIFISVVPMSLGGKYSMGCACPIFWSMQPSMPFSDKVNQIRILFQSDSVLFICNPEVESDDVMEEIRHELVSAQIEQEQREQAEAEKARYEEEQQKFINQFIEGNAERHTFQIKKEEDDSDTE